MGNNIQKNTGSNHDSNNQGNVNAPVKKKKPKYFFVYKIVCGLIRLFYPKPEVVGAEKIPPSSIIVGNHAQMNGPIVGEVYFPQSCYIWCASQMLHLKEVPAYAFEDFWSKKPKYIRWFYKLLSYIIAPLSVAVFNSAHTIPVYHDMRIVNTFRKTSEKMKDGHNIIIFPEHNVPYNNILWEFQENFISVAKYHHKRTGQEVSFVPMYVAPSLKKTFIGKPIKFDASAPFEEEQKRISQYLVNEITHMAQSLPEHTVVPYPNIPKKNYPNNKKES